MLLVVPELGAVMIFPLTTKLLPVLVNGFSVALVTSCTLL